MSDPSEKPQNARSRSQGAPPMPVTLAPVGSQVELAEIRGGKGLVFRLAEMGLTPGVSFTVVSRSRPGPLIINLRGTRLMLGAGMAARVYVRPV
ncbi:MAG: FeoA family protein [Phycisphaerae bacterium]